MIAGALFLMSGEVKLRDVDLFKRTALFSSIISSTFKGKSAV